MSERHQTAVSIDPWHALRAHTQARIALGRAGGSLPTREWLRFKRAHAAARDAVHDEFDAQKMADDIAKLGLEAVIVSSAAPDTPTFLLRPDLGRQLEDASRNRLMNLPRHKTPYDLAIAVSNGLSAQAVQHHAPSVLASLVPKLVADQWHLSPIAVVRFGRVAVQDEIGLLIGAQMALILVGERPGLGSQDSMGAYMVYSPQLSNTDAQRNCVSNIRPTGCSYLDAVETIHYLLMEARSRKLSGISLQNDRISPMDRTQALNRG